MRRHICQGTRRLTEKRAEEFARILNVRPEYLLGLDDHRTRDKKWFRSELHRVTKKSSIFESILNLLEYKIVNYQGEFDIDENGEMHETGGTFEIKKPSGEIIQIDDKTFYQIQNEIVNFARFQLESL